MKCQKWFVSNQRNERRRAERPHVRLFEDFKGSLRISHVRKYSSCSVVAKHDRIVKHRICFGSACETATGILSRGRYAVLSNGEPA